ncbi:hypothetical protein BDF21DRAFT_436398 [Thamnidium elegans]|uniref:Thioesterase n=1 Tax=Thamnidium elegans TaxID=101142 RepID=A0A8H7SSQ3_9FUNG|nr:hypothetical protein INT48_008521 [Thamnidium elegans]KAI8094659.1 hypothetical protein BDF21DRAFT_436398 [Thamnidium elegans]
MKNIPTKALAIGIPVGLLLTSHLKSLPFAYTVRSWFLLRALIKRAKENQMKPDPLFSIISQNHRCYLDDIDYNQHMNNGMYNKILDFSRIHLLYTIFPRVMMEPDHHIFGHSGGVVTLFRKEILPFAQYTVQTRIYTWNDKWLFLQHRFIMKGEEEGEDIIACFAFSKIVFKKMSGKTVPPQEVLQLCGHHFDKDVEERRSYNWDTAEHILKLDKIRTDPYSWSNL